MIRALLAAAILAATPAWADSDTYVDIERGRSLATIGDCAACHTPDPKAPYAGGRGIETPFGVINSANLTPDPTTGIGKWTPEDFARAMSQGVRPGGGHLYPAFPYTFYTRVTRADSDAIYTYLRTIPPVANKIDRNTLPFPFNIRASMIAWNALYFSPGEWKPDPAKSEEFNRGAYLVEGLGHCGACHTPLTTLGGSKNSEAYQGSQIQSWVAPNITNATRIGLADWSKDDIVQYLQTGTNARAMATGPMAEVIQISTSQMDPIDLRAMATYLKERGAAGSFAPTPLDPNAAIMQTGKSIYVDTCAACHTTTGAGIERIFPRLAGSQIVQQHDPTTLARVILTGTRAAATQTAITAPAMPALGWRLNDDQIAAVLTYIRNTWGNAAPTVSPSEVSRLRDKVSPK